MKTTNEETEKKRKQWKKALSEAQRRELELLRKITQEKSTSEIRWMKRDLQRFQSQIKSLRRNLTSLDS